MPLPSKTFSILTPATAPGRIAFLPVVLLCIGLNIVSDKNKLCDNPIPILTI